MEYSDYPKVIEVQFQNKCNSNCLICPYKDMNYKYEYMQDELFEKFLNEIVEEKMVRLIPYLNNEPFLEKKYLERLFKIRERFQKIEIEISSNVSVISEDNLIKLKQLNITELRLSVFGYNHDTYKKMMPGLNRDIVFKKLRMISNYLKDTNTIVSIVMIDNEEIEENEFDNMNKFCQELGFNFERWGFLDRSGNVSYKSNNISNYHVSMCEQNRPIERMHILANGDVIFCCQDWVHEYVVGNINSMTVSEIWNSKKYSDLRDSLYDCHKTSPTICQKCKLGH